MTGCMAPDRSEQARQLEAVLTGLPGVGDVKVSYVNDFENGAEIGAKVDLEHADPAQIAAAVERINAVRKHDFDRYRQSASFLVAQSATVQRGAVLDPDQIAGDARLLRDLRTRIPDGYLEWRRDDRGSRLEIRGLTETTLALDAAVAVLSGDPVTTVYIRSGDPTHAPIWEVVPPLNAEPLTAVRQLLARLPLRVYYVTVDGGRITELGVSIVDRNTAATDLESVVRTLAPSKDRPVTLEWVEHGADSRRQFRGSLNLPGCPQDPAAGQPRYADDRLDPQAVDLQRQLEQRFADCG
ncbi:hypothetical protein KIH27_07250 [Mycobacterium sp. M1]|uniref:Uncharacterized protein n=1 Tax=Mycolicibacter acidiphilus TaxID=2835306 RepID=A0ABS5RGH1_9MYCO|nr:hypothetical protein [Mycolicibacter acidiphilus]MBS9533387.1 hypothetical protein [Mycolicibacter acidiphilus]